MVNLKKLIRKTKSLKANAERTTFNGATDMKAAINEILVFGELYG